MQMSWGRADYDTSCYHGRCRRPAWLELVEELLHCPAHNII